MGQQHTSPQNTTLVLVCKRPLLHQGKQRIAAQVGAEQALAVARLLLACSLEDLTDWPGTIVIAPSHEDDAEWAMKLLPDNNVLVLPQCSGNLGERLNQLDSELRRWGYKHLIFMGSDSPTLKLTHLSEAALRLQTCDTVFNKASDGGVVLMGNRTPWPDLASLPWSTDALGTALADLCDKNGLSVGYALPGDDIDHRDDLLRVLTVLKKDPRPARQALAKHIESVFLQTP